MNKFTGHWMTGIAVSFLAVACTGDKCDPKSGESCRVLPETVGLSAYIDPNAPPETPTLPTSLNLEARFESHSEVMVRDSQDDVVSILYLPFSLRGNDAPAFIARLAGARGYSFSRPHLPEGCRISHLGYSYLETGAGTGVIEFSAREPKAGSKPCLDFFRAVETDGLDVKFADVPVYSDRPAVQIRLTADPLPERPRTASRTRSRQKHRFRAD